MAGQSELSRFVSMTRERIHQSVADLEPGEWTARPQGLAPILWQVGHLALVDGEAARRLGRPVTIPESFQSLFRYGSTGDGPYPDPKEVLALFNQVSEELAVVAQGDLAQPSNDPSGRTQTIGDLLVFLIYHRGYHHGKIMTLRSLLGKPRLLG